MNLFVAKLSTSTTGDDLQELFSAYGEVASAKVIFDRETGNSKGFGFVEMPNDEEANAAIAALNDSEVDGKQIVVKEANPPSERPRGGGGFNRGGGGGFNRGGGGGGYNRGGGGGGYNRDGGDRRGGGERRGGGDRRGGGGYNSDRGGDRGGNRW
jgi:RNA recognition motif-containing protein